MGSLTTYARIALLAVIVIAAPAAPAQATFPGVNGKILSGAGNCLELFDPAGGGGAQPGACGFTLPPFVSGGPLSISPDGNRVSGAVYDIVDDIVDTRLSNLDGTGAITIPGTHYEATYSSWSVDGARVATFDVGTFLACCSNDMLRWAPSDGSSAPAFLATGNAARAPWSNSGRVAWTYSNLSLGNTTLHSGLPGGGQQAVASAASVCCPDWSPATSRIGFNRNGDIVETNIDGSGLQVLATGVSTFTGPSYSPTGERILFHRAGEVWVANADGSGAANVTNNAATDREAIWSPDGQKIAFVSNRDGDYDIWAMNRDGSGVVQVSNDAGTDLLFDWQPILKGYPRPKGAGTQYTPLVPAYQPCTTPNRAHAAPLSFGSCNPPAQTSPRLTVGTPDANGQGAKSVASIKLGVNPGIPGAPDDAEVGLTASITDIRNTSDLTDYTGELQARIDLRVTDKSNTPYPGGPGPGTVQDFTYSFTIPCAPTPDTTIGATCSLATTADTLVAGTVLEGRRAIWQTGQVEVTDGGPDGLAATTAGNTVFMRQGIFVP